MESMETRFRTSPKQFEALIEFMERNGDISRSQLGIHGRVKADMLWVELGKILNSCGSTVKRPEEKWRKVWADWKTKTKKKSSQLSGPDSKKHLSTIEQRVLKVMGYSVADLTVAEESCDTPSLQNANGSMETTVISSNLTEEVTKDSKSLNPPLVETLPKANVSVTRRRRFLRRRKGPIYLKRPSAQLIAIEHRHLQLEEMRERNFYEIEMKKLQLESRRLQLEENRNDIFKSIVSSINNLPDMINQLLERHYYVISSSN